MFDGLFDILKLIVLFSVVITVFSVLFVEKLLETTNMSWILIILVPLLVGIILIIIYFFWKGLRNK